MDAEFNQLRIFTDPGSIRINKNYVPVALGSFSKD